MSKNGTVWGYRSTPEELRRPNEWRRRIVAELSAARTHGPLLLALASTMVVATGCGDDDRGLNVQIELTAATTLEVKLDGVALLPSDETVRGRVYRIDNEYAGGLADAVALPDFRVDLFENGQVAGTGMLPRTICSSICEASDCSELGVLVSESVEYDTVLEIPSAIFRSGRVHCIGTEAELLGE